MAQPGCWDPPGSPSPLRGAAGWACGLITPTGVDRARISRPQAEERGGRLCGDTPPTFSRDMVWPDPGGHLQGGRGGEDQVIAKHFQQEASVPARPHLRLELPLSQAETSHTDQPEICLPLDVGTCLRNVESRGSSRCTCFACPLEATLTGYGVTSGY